MNFPGHTIKMESRIDKHGNVFYIGKCRTPQRLSLKEGVGCFLFTSEKEAEELHLNCVRPNSRFFKIKKKNPDEKYYIPLRKTVDSESKQYYLAMVKADLELDLSKGVVFMAFTSKEGKEQLQISYPTADESEDYQQINE